MRYYDIETARLTDSAAAVRDKIKHNARAMYRETRRDYPTYPARHAWQYARDDAYCATVWPMLELWGLVRLDIVPDEVCMLEDLAGDCFNPDVNTDIPPARLAEEYRHFCDRVDRDGVWGIVGEWRLPIDAAVDDADAWQHADSCFGFVGDDWKGSGHDADIMRQAMRDLVDAIFGGSGTGDLFDLDELESLLIIARNARRLYLAA